MKKKVVHLTSVHARQDTRIFFKECNSLVKAGYDVSLVVADGLGNEEKNGVKIYDVGKQNGRINRILNTTKNVFKKCVELNADLYHFHDPELIPIGLKLKKLKKKVIFDSHEDVEKDILSKEWIPFLIRKPISCFYREYEKYACRKFDYIVAATPHIKNRFIDINKKTININNFPILNELSNEIPWKNKKNEICYVGSITKIRGIKELINAIGFDINVILNLVGTFSEKDIEAEVKKYIGWSKVNELGFLSRENVSNIMSQSKAGMVTLHPSPNHMDAQPNKMFEYMSAGLPIITSNFPLWKELVEGSNCGICVDPLNPKEILEAIEFILLNPKEAEQMGKNGKKVVIEKYNWGVEEKKLFDIYNID